MYKNFFKRQWIGQDMIDYIKSLPRLFRVTYEVAVGGRSVSFPLRDEDGNIVAGDDDFHAQNVVSLTVHYQQEGDCERIGVFGKLDKDDLNLFKKAFAKLEKECPKSNSKVQAKSLHAMQQQLRDGGYDAQIVKNETNNMFRVVATTFDSKVDAVNSRDQIRGSKFNPKGDAWLLYNVQ